MQKSVKPKIYDAYSGTLFFIYKEKKKKSQVSGKKCIKQESYKRL